MDSRKKIEIAMLAAVIVFSVFMVLGVHTNYTGLAGSIHDVINTESEFRNFAYPYPIHADEWTHLAQGIYIMESKTLGFANPYSPSFDFHRDFESGFHIFLAFFFGITGLDPVLNYQYLPALFFALNSVLLFMLVRKFTGNYFIALLSIPFYLAIPSNTNFLGNWFAIPLTFSIFLIYLFFFTIEKIFKKKNLQSAGISVFVFALMAIAYPPAAMLSAAILLPYVIIEKKIYEITQIKNNLPFVGIISAGILIFGLFILTVFSDTFLFPKSWNPFPVDYKLIEFYGIIPFGFALIGMIMIFIKKINKFFILWPALAFANILFFMATENAILIPYDRTLFYGLLGLAPVAAIGMYYSFEFIYFKLNNVFSKSDMKHILSITIVGLLAVSAFYIAFADYYSVENRDVVLTFFIEDRGYDAIKFIGDTYGSGKIVFADPLMSIGVYPIARGHIVAMRGSNLGYGNPDETLPFFFNTTCEDKEQIMQKTKPDFVLSIFPIKCSFLQLVYSEGDFVYLVVLNG